MRDLETALQADPDDEGTWLVYVDHLIATGDPRGEIAAAQRERGA